MVTRTQAILNFLKAKARPHISDMYGPQMECQVMVAQDGGERIEGEYEGKRWTGWTDHIYTWKAFRIPRNANSKPEYFDSEISFDLAAHCEAIGMTGWDFVNLKSRWVGFDFDAIVGHKDSHTSKLTDEQLAEVRDFAINIPWVTTQQSTSGNGLHLYVFLDGVDCQNHCEHAALGRAILGKMSALTGFDFESKVDNCFSGDTEIITDEGVFTLKELEGKNIKIRQLTPKGEIWANATVKSFGNQKTRKIKFGNSQFVQVTDNHKWMFYDYKTRVQWGNFKYTTDLTKLTRLPLSNIPLPKIDWEGWAHGYVYGDGWEVDYHGTRQTEVAIFEDNPQEIVEKLTKYGRSVGSRRYSGVYRPMVYGLPAHWKNLPKNPTKEYVFGFLLGLHAADGKMGHGGGILITQSNFEVLKQLQKWAISIGLRAYEPNLEGKGNFENSKDGFSLYIETSNFDSSLMVRRDYKKKFVKTKRISTSVIYSSSETVEQEVFCVIAPNWHNFALANGVFTSNCGGNIWIWHRKFEAAGGINGPGLKLIKKGEILKDVPPNWQDHIKVITGKTKKNVPEFVTEIDEFSELCGQRSKVPLDADHRKLIKFLEENRVRDWWWDADNWMVVCHTLDLQEAHKNLGLKGIFKTSSSGSSSQNTFMYPMRKGAWSVRRHTPGVQEADSWEQDGSGWTRCYLNREPDLATSAKISGGVENDKGAFVFRETETAITAAAGLGAHVELPNFMMGRQASLRPHKDGRLIFEIEHTDTDNAEKMQGWNKTKRGGLWQRILNTQAPAHYDSEISNYEDIVRHLVVESGKDAGWVIKSDGKWCDERLEHIKCVLASIGVQKQDLPIVLGSSIMRRWTIVNRPFQPEYPGDRQWNRDAVQFSVAPALDLDSLRFDEWTKLLNHSGSGLDSAIKEHPWCKANGIVCGGDYLKLWIAWMFQHPLEQLPYLFLYGPEGSGKSIFYESIELLVTRGVERADAALISPNGFNGELAGKILCVVEETDLRQGKSMARNRIKDWVTARSAPIHAKNGTPYTVPNSWHWVQTANDIGFCPTFPGDTRIVVTYVKELEAHLKINKTAFLGKLKKQAPDFLAHILHIDLPEPDDRLNIPIIATEEKKQAQSANRTVLEEFLADMVHSVDGELIKMSELHERLIEWLPPSLVSEWSIIRFGREIVKLGYVKGRNMSRGAQFYVANVSFEKVESTKPRITLQEDKLTWHS